MPDFVTLLTDDHRRVERLFKQFDQTADFTVALAVCLELKVHTTVEEELLYDLYAAQVDELGAAEARREHQKARDLISEIEAMDAASDDLMPTMTKLKTVVLHNVDDEEIEIFPKVLERIPDVAATLGDEMAARKVEVEARLLLVDL